MEGEWLNGRRIRNKAQGTDEKPFDDQKHPLINGNAKEGYRRKHFKNKARDTNEFEGGQKRLASGNNANENHRANDFHAQKMKETEVKQLFADSKVQNENTKKEKRNQHGRKKESDKNGADGKIKEKLNSEKENKWSEQRRYSTPVSIRQYKRPVPAVNYVSTTRKDIPLIYSRYQSYTILPPRDCNHSKMTFLKLKNVDSCVDESVLFWAFKKYGWIENVYVVRNSFIHRQTGVAFVGFKSGAVASRVVAKSGDIQLFGRPITVQMYGKRREKTDLLTLPIVLLCRIFAFLDWRTRIRCESVCGTFRSLLVRMCERGRFAFTPDMAWMRETWIGFPQKVTFVFIGNGVFEKFTKEASSEVIIVRIDDDANFNAVLRSILCKFSSKVIGLEIYGLTLCPRTMRILCNGGMLEQPFSQPLWDAGRILLKDCTLNDVVMGELYGFQNYYGDRLAVE